MSNDVDRPAPGADQGRSDMTRPLIVGVGASASAAASIERFLSRLTLDPDQAVVLVIQHREALDAKRLQQFLQKMDGIKIAEIHDGTTVLGGTLYLCGPNVITTVQDGKFAVRAAEQAPGERATIDSFLVSLGEERAEEAIGVVLAGTGGDGTLGVATLKDHGGLAIAERVHLPDSEQLAESNTPSAIADFILPPEEIAEHVGAYARHLRRVQERKGFDEVLAGAASSLTRIADILRSK